MALGPFVQCIVDTVKDPARTRKFVKHPKRVLKKYDLTRKERKILRKGLFRQEVCAYLVDGRPGPPIIEGGG